MRKYKTRESGGKIMKRIVCSLSLVAFLFLGSVAAFADPFGTPDTENVRSVNPPIVTTAEPVSE